MIHVITGDDIVSSRNKLTELTSGHTNAVRIDGKKSSLAEIETALESNSLFSEQKVVVIEQFASVKPQEKLAELVSKFEKDKDTDVILWDEAEPSLKIANIKGSKTFSYTFPKIYFAFLDTLSPKDSKKTLDLLHQVLKTYAPEQVLYSIIKRIRQLLIIKTDSYTEFADFKKMQSWQIGKLKKQANLWSEEQLRSTFLSFAGLDEKLKTSSLTMDLANHLDILLLYL